MKVSKRAQTPRLPSCLPSRTPAVEAQTDKRDKLVTSDAREREDLIKESLGRRQSPVHQVQDASTKEEAKGG